MKWNGLKHREALKNCEKGKGPRERRNWSIGKDDPNWRAGAS